MSARALPWARRQRIEDPTLTAVLIALANKADGTHSCALTQSEIATLSKRKERAVRGALGLLVQFGVVVRQSRGANGARGRLPDLIILSVDRQFDLSKEAIMAARKTASECREIDVSNRHGDAGNSDSATGSVPDAHIDPLARVVLRRARAPISIVSGKGSRRSPSSRFWWDKRQGRWRARVHYQGLKMDLGLFDFREDADRACRDALADIDHATQNPTGVPREPVRHPHLESLNGAALCDFLFESDEEMGRPTRRAAAGSGSKDEKSLAEGEAEPRDHPEDDGGSFNVGGMGLGEEDRW